MSKVEQVRPEEPSGEDATYYRGWECGWCRTREYYSGEGYYAAKGGVDLDCQQVFAKTWSELLDLVDDEEDN